jgi:cyclohexanone monooxygenase
VTDVEVLIVGAGISGIGAAIELTRRGNRGFLILESASDVGGTWRDNTYPGIAVDIPSISYCYPFETNYAWSRVFATGGEIQRYVRHCAEKYGVTDRIRFNSRVVRSDFDAGRDVWVTRLADGSTLTSRFLIAATGLFAHPRLPEIAGLETFAGTMFHTAHWNHDHDLTGRRIALIGTGASAVQILPEIAPRVAALSVFQRTPIWISRKFDRAVSAPSRLSPRRLRAARALSRFVSEAGIEFLSFAVVNFRRFPFIVRTVQRTVRVWMRRQVRDPEMAAKLLPVYGLGCKRPTISNGYLATFNRENVHLVTESIARVCAEGIVTQDGRVHAVDTIVLATGFLTTERGNTPSFEVVGSSGEELGALWAEHGRQAYAGVSMPGFPNFFLTFGPYSGGFNWFTMLDAHLTHVMACMDVARSRGATRLEVTRDAHDRYMRHMRQRAEGTVFKDASCATARSYYLDWRGEASLPFPHSPWWRVVRELRTGARDYQFTTRAGQSTAASGEQRLQPAATA